MSIENVYLIYGSDFKKRSWIDWILSHIMGAPPIHRYWGSITFYYDSFEFYGNDTIAKEEVSFTIQKKDITQLYYGFDGVFSVLQTRGMGLSGAPIRFTLVDTDSENNEKYLYLVFGNNELNFNNKTLFEELKIWMS
jgi:hypothetical protein